MVVFNFCHFKNTGDVIKAILLLLGRGFASFSLVVVLEWTICAMDFVELKLGILVYSLLHCVNFLQGERRKWLAKSLFFFPFITTTSNNHGENMRTVSIQRNAIYGRRLLIVSLLSARLHLVCKCPSACVSVCPCLLLECKPKVWRRVIWSVSYLQGKSYEREPHTEQR